MKPITQKGIALILIFGAIAIATVLLLIGGCGAAAPEGIPPAAVEPEPSPVLRAFKLSRTVQVIEFRDSAGRVCVVVLSGSLAASTLRPVGLDCGRPAAVDYERLPEPQVTPIPERGSFRSRPL